MSRLRPIARGSFPMLVGASLLLAAACGSSTVGTTGAGGHGGTTTSSSTSTTGTTGTTSTTSTTSTTGTAGAGGLGATTSTTSSGTGGLPPGACETQADCTTGEFCGVEILPPYCGGCDTSFLGDCASDADCQDAGANYICGTPCNCDHGGAQPQNHCARGCAEDPDCGPSMACDPTHRCVAASCTGASDCTANFTCSSGTCGPKACTSDGACDGYCVDGSCSPILGTCAAAVP